MQNIVVYSGPSIMQTFVIRTVEVTAHALLDYFNVWASFI